MARARRSPCPLRAGANGQSSSQRFEPLAHAEEAEPALAARGVEANAAIGDGQEQPLSIAGETHRNRPRAAVLDGIAEPLVHDAEQAQRDIARHCIGDIRVREVDRDFVLLRQLTSQPATATTTPINSSFGGCS